MALGAEDTQPQKGALLCMAEAMWLLGLPRKMPRSVSNGTVTPQAQRAGCLLQGTPLLKYHNLVLEQEVTIKTAALRTRDLPQRLLKSVVVQEMGLSLETQLMEKSHWCYEYMNND